MAEETEQTLPEPEQTLTSEPDALHFLDGELPIGAEWLSLGAMVLAALLAVVGIILLGRTVQRVFRLRGSEHRGIVLRKLISYLGFVILIISILWALGVDLTGLLATAGIATVAIGFAAQTSLSNLISGLFLIGEKPFEIGDLIRVGQTTGRVESIDLLSIKLRTLDNVFVRIPNEEMLKTQFTNVTRYPLRRMDFDLRFSYVEDPDQIVKVLERVAEQNHFALDDPPPLILFNHLGESAMEFRFGVWFEKTRYVELRNSILRDVRRACADEDIEFAFPHLTVYAGSESRALRVRLESGDHDEQLEPADPTQPNTKS